MSARIVNTIAEAIDDGPDPVTRVTELSREILYALRANGFEVVELPKVAGPDETGSYRVPVEGYKLWEIELLHDAGWEYAFIPEARQLRAALAAALSTLAEVRAEHQPKSEPCCDCSRICVPCALECTACGTQWPCTTSAILDRSTP